MKISDKDKKLIASRIRRESHLDAINNGMDIRSKPHKNKKKYSRKNKHKNENN